MFGTAKRFPVLLALLLLLGLESTSANFLANFGNKAEPVLPEQQEQEQPANLLATPKDGIVLQVSSEEHEVRILQTIFAYEFNMVTIYGIAGGVVPPSAVEVTDLVRFNQIFFLRTIASQFGQSYYSVNAVLGSFSHTTDTITVNYKLTLEFQLAPGLPDGAAAKIVVDSLVGNESVYLSGFVNVVQPEVNFKYADSIPFFSSELLTTPEPTIPPTTRPSQSPSLRPSSSPSISGSGLPSLVPSQAPSTIPSITVSMIPSTVPSNGPSKIPSLSPSRVPSSQPSVSNSPSLNPSLQPSDIPSSAPSKQPTVVPSALPSMVPSVSQAPSPMPVSPSSKPSLSPSFLSSAPSLSSNTPSLSSNAPSLSSNAPSVTQPSQFNIQYAFIASPSTPMPTPAQNSVLATGRKIELIVTGDISDISLNGGGTATDCAITTDVVDDLFLCTKWDANITGNTLGFASLRLVRSANTADAGLTVAGQINLRTNIDNNAVTLQKVVEHEILHILGIGTLWDREDLGKDLVNNKDSPNCNYKAATKAGAAFHDISGCGDTVDIPMQPGTCAHWDKTCFGGTELMESTFVQARNPNISAITVASLEDLGYTVDMSAAEPLTDAGFSAACMCTPQNLGSSAKLTHHLPLSPEGTAAATKDGLAYLKDVRITNAERLGGEEYAAFLSSEAEMGGMMVVVFVEENGLLHDVVVRTDDTSI